MTEDFGIREARALSAEQLYPERIGRRTAERLFSIWWKRNCPVEWTVVNVDHILPVNGNLGEEDTWVVSKYGDALLIVETALDTGQDSKICSVTRSLASCVDYRRAYCVLLTPSSDEQEISAFRIKRLWPEDPEEWPGFLPATSAQLVHAFTKAREWCLEQREKR